MWYRMIGEILGHAFGTFGKKLITVLRRLTDGLHDLVYKLERHIGMKEVGHGADKDIAASSPMTRFVEVFGVNGWLEAIGVLRHPHRGEATSHGLCIAVCTSGRLLGAASDGIPCTFCPFYFCCSHNSVKYHFSLLCCHSICKYSTWFGIVSVI